MTFWQFSTASALQGDWLFPTETRFGAGRIGELADVLGQIGIHRPLIVTDRGLTATPVPDRIVSLASERSSPLLWADADQNPTGEQVMAGAEAFHAHRADGVIALGGGSGLDCGKSVALLAGLGGDLWRFAYPRSLEVQAERSPVPIIAIPTTAGTGAEVEASGIITNHSEAGEVRHRQSVDDAAGGDRRSGIDAVLAAKSHCLDGHGCAVSQS